jgi:hypothetical protein
LYVQEWPAVLRVVAVAALASTSCAPVVHHPPYAAQPTAALVEVGSPPPPGRVEIVPADPAADAVWVDGEWVWRRERWAWLSGRWVRVPPGAAFSPWVFERGLDGRLWCAAGVWRDASGSAIDPPAALATAAVEAGSVVNADGTSETTGPTLRQRPRPASSTK